MEDEFNCKIKGFRSCTSHLDSCSEIRAHLDIIDIIDSDFERWCDQMALISSDIES